MKITGNNRTVTGEITGEITGGKVKLTGNRFFFKMLNNNILHVFTPCK